MESNDWGKRRGERKREGEKMGGGGEGRGWREEPWRLRGEGGGKGSGWLQSRGPLKKPVPSRPVPRDKRDGTGLIKFFHFYLVL